MAFSVKAGEFEGPLDLLLALVEERKMLVSDVSLSSVADAFLDFITKSATFPMREAAQFIVVAATLLLIKSRALLPVLSLTDEEEGDIKDLELRLKLLQIMRTAARTLGSIKSRLFIGEGSVIAQPLFVPPPDLSAASLPAAARATLTNKPKKKFIDEVPIETVVSLDEMIERLTARVQKAISMTFRDFSGNASDPREVVVGFLAVLELVKRGFANVTQSAHFDEITIEYAGGAGTPRYE